MKVSLKSKLSRLKVGLPISCLIFLLVLVSSGEGAVVSDLAGRSVTVPEKVSRIVCVGPGALRLAVYLEAASRVVGVERMEKRFPRGRPYWLAHPELHDLPVIGPGGAAAINRKPDLEAILVLKPDLVLATYWERELADEISQALGIPVVVLSYGSSPAWNSVLRKSIEVAGKILGREARAKDLIRYVDDLKHDLARRTASIPAFRKPRAYVGAIGYRGSHGITSTEDPYPPFLWTATPNAVRSMGSRLGSHVFVDKEQLLAMDPHVIFIDGGGVPLVREDFHRHPAFYKALSAFRSRRVFILFPFNFYAANLETILVDAYVVGKLLYPKHFQDVDLEEISGQIFRFFVGRDVYRDMVRDYGVPGDSIFLE